MSWWQILLVAYLILTPFSEIFTIAWIMVLVQELQYKRRKKRQKIDGRSAIATDTVFDQESTVICKGSPDVVRDFLSLLPLEEIDYYIVQVGIKPVRIPAVKYLRYPEKRKSVDDA